MSAIKGNLITRWHVFVHVIEQQFHSKVKISATYLRSKIIQCLMCRITLFLLLRENLGYRNFSTISKILLLALKWASIRRIYYYLLYDNTYCVLPVFAAMATWAECSSNKRENKVIPRNVSFYRIFCHCYELQAFAEHLA